MDNTDQHSALPDSVETLLNWKLTNSDVPFSDDEFMDGFEQHAKDANALFKRAFSKSMKRCF